MPLPLPLRRRGYRVAHAMLRAWWLVRRPTTRGAKLLLHDGGGRVLMVRHTYGKRDEWELPGGSLGRREAPQDGAAREAHEELGVRLAWRPVVALPVGGAGKLTMLHLFEADLDGADLNIDGGEIAETRWVDPADPPLPLGRDAVALLAVATRR